MASTGSFPFVVDTVVESSILLHSISHRRPKFVFSANRPRRSIDIGDVDSCAFGSLRALGDGIGKLALSSSGCSRNQKRRMTRLTAKGEGSVDDVESEDALQASIEKSKKVLAMQKELLEQIAERRKVVSSIKSSIKETEEDGPSGGEKNGTVSTLSMVPTLNDDNNDVYNPDTLSSSPQQYSLDGLEKKSPPFITEGMIEGSNGSGKNLTQTGTPSSADSSKSLKTASAKKFQQDELPHVSPTFSTLPKTPTLNSNIPIKGSRSGMLTARTESQKQLEDKSKVIVESQVPSFLSESLTLSSVENEKRQDGKVSNLDEASIIAEDPANEETKPPPLAGANLMNVILVAAECAPWSKTGGLGDVAGALPKALARRGHRVMVVAPRYGDYAEPQNTGVRKIYKIDGQDVEVNYFQIYKDGVDFVFIDSHMFRHIENNIYGGKREDILKRMVLFCKAAVEVPWHVPCGGVCYGDGNLVFIANDWHTALLPVYLKAYYRDNGLMKYTRSVLVIHNIAHQGRGPVDDFSYVDLPPHYMDLFRLYDPVGGEHLNIFAAGLKTADRVVTVSHGYAWELKTSEGGWGLHGIISENDWKFRGIVNGIDTKEWSPELDVFLNSDGYTNYSLDTLYTGKAQCKSALQKELGLPVREDVPLIGFIGRLDHQKGVDLIAEAVPWMMSQDVQLVMLGTGRPDLEQMLRQFESQYNDKARGWVGFSVKTAHRITAGADILLMPSRFEPCGLNQLYAMRYGTIPVVHAVGGLRDTVQPFDPFNETGLGWTFNRAEASQLIHALGNCLLTYRQYKNSWEGLQRRGMMQDLSWDNAAENYEEVLVAAKYQW